MTKSKILIQLDPDKHASTFDAIVAADAGVDHILQYAQVQTSDVRDIVYGAIFTRGPGDLKNTAIFIGGSDVAAGEALLGEVTATFLPTLKVSVMMDANGCNTTASAAVVAASRHLRLENSTALVLAGTGPVGQRIARLLAARGATVYVASRVIDRAARVCDTIVSAVPDAKLIPAAPASDEDILQLLASVEQVFCAGASKVQLLPQLVWRQSTSLRVAIDLNAVPPLGIEGIQAHDKAAMYDGLICYGAVGVGRTKMKIHHEAIRRLFTDNSLRLDVDSIFQIGMEVEAANAGIKNG